MIETIEMGWLSPEGELIEAGYLYHISVADEIVEKRYSTLYVEDGAPDDWLINHGWVHISRLVMLGYKYIITWNFIHHLTQAQKEWLKPRVEENWNWIEDFCKTDLITELNLDTNLFNINGIIENV